MQAATRALFVATLGFVALAGIAPAGATSNQTYKPGEYVLVTQGLSPDRHQSIRAHGDGELGTDNFHVYLFRESPQKRVGALEEIETLDTAADSITANWAPSSQAVAIQYRSDRHVVDVTAYQLANNRAFQITGPSLLQAATQQTPATLANQQTASFTDWVWAGPGRFTLRVTQTYRGKPAPLVSAFGRYGKLADDIGDGTSLVLFSAEADCELSAQHSFKVLSIKPGDFQQ